MLPDYAAALVLGVLGGAAFGVRALAFVKAEKLELVFSALVLVIGLKMFFAPAGGLP